MSYPNLQQISDPVLQRAVKVACDRLNAQELLRRGLSTAGLPLPTAAIPFGNQRATSFADPLHDTDGVTQKFMVDYINGLINDFTQSVTPQGHGLPPGPPIITPPKGDGCNDPGKPVTDLSVAYPNGVPGRPNVRFWRGNFCGLRVPGISSIPGGASDQTLVPTWFLNRYSAADQATILSAYAAAGFTHFQLSWPNSRDDGLAVGDFVALASSIKAAGIPYVCVFLFSKDNDPHNPDPTSIDPVLNALIAAGAVDSVCIGWELNLVFMSGSLGIYGAIDHIGGICSGAGIPCYVHFTTEYISWQDNGQPGSAFWIHSIGKLTGILYQANVCWNAAMLQARLIDVQKRFAGFAGYPTDSGFGHPFDIVPFEISAYSQFFGGESQRDGDQQGFIALCSPGPIACNGYGNGCAFNP